MKKHIIGLYVRNVLSVAIQRSAHSIQQHHSFQLLNGKLFFFRVLLVDYILYVLCIICLGWSYVLFWFVSVVWCSKKLLLKLDFFWQSRKIRDIINHRKILNKRGIYLTYGKTVCIWFVRDNFTFSDRFILTIFHINILWYFVWKMGHLWLIDSYVRLLSFVLILVSVGPRYVSAQGNN